MALVTDRADRRPDVGGERRGRTVEFSLVDRAGPVLAELPSLRRGSPRRSGTDVGPLDPVRMLGRALIWLGALVLSFAAFQLWGTGVLAWHAQRGLDAEFDLRRAAMADSAPDRSVVDAGRAGAVAMGLRLEPFATGGDGGEPVEAARPAVLVDPAAEGTAVARIEIPAIGLRQTVLQGVGRHTLRSGPGHYPSTPMPGEGGNVAIAGHRTTYGAPFLELDELEPGDRIAVETADGVFRYEVQGHEAPDGTVRGHHIVDPAQVEVIADHGDDRLTLTACHPRYSARQRIIVTARLVDQPPPGAPTPPPDRTVDRPAAAARQVERLTADPSATVSASPDSFEASLGWRAEELDPTAMWATVTALVLHGGWVLGRLWRRRWAYAISAPAAAVPLLVCFVHLDRLLPAF